MTLALAVRVVIAVMRLEGESDLLNTRLGAPCSCCACLGALSAMLGRYSMQCFGHLLAQIAEKGMESAIPALEEKLYDAT